MKFFCHSSITSLLLLTVLIFSCEPEPKRNKSFDNLTKKHIIPVDKGIGMYNEFQKKRTGLIEPELKKIYEDDTFVDSKFVWFSLEDIKEYLAYIDAIQKENPKQDVSGLRIYFAAYPNVKEYKGKQVRYPRQQTVFMAPTVATESIDEKYKNLNHLPFYINADSSNPLKGDFEIIEALMLDYKKQKRLDIYNKRSNFQKASFNLNIASIMSKRMITSALFNEGEMSPPPNK